MKVFYQIFTLLLVATACHAMETLQSSFNNLCSILNKRITYLAQKTVFKKKDIRKAYARLKINTPQPDWSAHPVYMFSVLHNLATFNKLLNGAESLKERMRDIQHTIYIQQATISGLKAIAVNKYALDHQIQYMVPLIQGNSKMYYPITTAAQHALQECYELADKRQAGGTPWFAAVKEVESEVTTILQENQNNLALFTTTFNKVIQKLKTFEHQTPRAQQA